jgi:peptidoglycan/LPS O-acetylase OafA/YrhL
MTGNGITSSGAAPQTDQAEAGGGRSIAYQPALDGVRALAVLVVLLFHAEVTGFSGGYLGVSVFFTLSGYLITSLLVSEDHATGRIRVGSFYARRARRLLPASIVCIGGVVAISALTDVFDAVSQLRRDVIGSLLQVANWVFLFGDGSYQNLFQQAAGELSPLEHYWSLAIEEQFYWLWPIAFVGLVRLAPTAHARLVALAAVTALAAVAAPVIASVWGPDAAYWATPARASEILFGALLAVVIHGRQRSARWGLLAPVALAVLAVLVVTFPAAGGPAYSGALPLVAMVSTALLLGLQVAGPVRSALSVRPLVWIGTISYGVYLYHWPVFLILDAQRTGLDGAALVALRFAVTFALAQLSFMLIELPIRRSTSLTLRPTLIGAGLATAAMITVGILVIPSSDSDYWSVSGDLAEAAAIEESSGTLPALVAGSPPTVDANVPRETAPPQSAPAGNPPVAVAGSATPGSSDPASTEPTSTQPASTQPVASAPPPIPALERPVRILIAGDSTAQATGVGAVTWAAEQPDLAQVALYSVPGCGFVTGGTYLLPDREVEVPSGCADWVDNLPGRIDEVQADVVALLTTAWDVQDRRWGDEGLSGPTTDPAVAARVRQGLVDLTEDVLEQTDAAVAWIRQPIPDVGWDDERLAQEQPERHALLYDTFDELAARYPDRVHVIDLPAFVAAAGLADDRAARPDGVHWTPEVATRIVNEYLGEQLIRAALNLEPH